MKIIVTSIIVADQAKALKFYTEVLGFVKKTEVDLGEYQWLTVVSPSSPEGVELSLEPNANPISNAFQIGLFDAGIPITIFGVDNIQMEFERLMSLGVVFRMAPTDMGTVIMANLEDTCGNIIGLVQHK